MMLFPPIPKVRTEDGHTEGAAHADAAVFDRGDVVQLAIEMDIGPSRPIWHRDGKERLHRLPTAQQLQVVDVERTFLRREEAPCLELRPVEGQRPPPQPAL